MLRPAAKAGGTTGGPSSCNRMRGRIDSQEVSMGMSFGLLALVVGLGGCALLAVVVVAAVWAITHDRPSRN